jgi:glucosamine-6-phosphate deaminase
MGFYSRHLRCKDESSWVAAANTWLVERKATYSAQSVYLPAGETPKALYKNWQAENHDFLKSLKFIQIDDVATGPKKHIFRQFFIDHLASYQRQMCFFDRGDEVADLAILGLGMNGHVAFHEPGIEAAFFSGCLPLTAKTLEVLDLEKGTWGQTFGLGAFLKTKSILMIVKGAKKAEVVDRMLSGDTQLPASALLKHKDFTLITDF